MLFLLHGAVDLALTQILVETISLVVFVLVLRRLPQHFTDRPLARTRYWRMLIALAVAVVVEDGGRAGNEAYGGSVAGPISSAVMKAALQ